MRHGQAILEEAQTYGDPLGELDHDAIAATALTMVGRRRLENIARCVRDVVENGIPGDVVETGVWRGGASIVMRGALVAYGASERKAYVADSFDGLPEVDPRYPADAPIGHLHESDFLRVSLETVRQNFDRFGLLDENVVFVKGRFRDTLPDLRGNTWSVIRLDGDYYESTIDGLVNLYPGLSVGGWLVVDDYHVEACRQAVDDYCRQHSIAEDIVPIDNWSACWQRTR